MIMLADARHYDLLYLYNPQQMAMVLAMRSRISSYSQPCSLFINALVHFAMPPQSSLPKSFRPRQASPFIYPLFQVGDGVALRLALLEDNSYSRICSNQRLRGIVTTFLRSPLSSAVPVPFVVSCITGSGSRSSSSISNK